MLEGVGPWGMATEVTAVVGIKMHLMYIFGDKINDLNLIPSG